MLLHPLTHLAAFKKKKRKKRLIYLKELKKGREGQGSQFTPQISITARDGAAGSQEPETFLPGLPCGFRDTSTWTFFHCFSQIY